VTNHQGGDAASENYAALARTWARNTVLGMVREMGGRVVARPVFRSASDLDMTITDAEPIVGLHAAVSLMRAARSFGLEYVRKAREDGSTWHEIGEALELPGHADRERPAAYADFGFGFATDGGSRPSITWICPACRSTVIDHGPEAGPPIDAEAGHSEACSRLASAMKAWNASWEAGVE
jgi:hypothetical protein